MTNSAYNNIMPLPIIHGKSITFLGHPSGCPSIKLLSVH